MVHGSASRSAKRPSRSGFVMALSSTFYPPGGHYTAPPEAAIYSRAMDSPKTLFNTARQYFQRNPDELRRFVRNALGLRLSVPLDAIRWLAEQAVSKGPAGKIEVES